MKVCLHIKKLQTDDSTAIQKLDTGRYTPEYLTEREQVKYVSILLVTENKTTLCQWRNQGLSSARKRT